MIFYIFVLVLVGGFLVAERSIELKTWNRNLTTSTVEHSLACRLCYIGAAIILIVVAGLRYYVGTDFGAYYKGYSTYADALWVRTVNLNEPGYSLIAAIARSVVDDPAAAIFLASLVTVGICAVVIFKNTNQTIYALLLYVFLGCWHGSFNGTRQYLAASVFFLGYPYLRDRKFWKYTIFVFLAFLCHKSAIVMIALYFVTDREVSVKNIFLLIVLCWVFIRSNESLFRIAEWVLEDSFAESDFTNSSVNLIRIMVACAPAVFFLFVYFKNGRPREGIFYINLMLVHAALTLITMNSPLLQRINIYTRTFQTIAIGESLKLLDKQTRKIVGTVILTLFAGFWLYEISVRSHMIPFHWVWER